MFEHTAKEAFRSFPQNGAVVALIGGTPDEMLSWAKANLDLSVVSCFMPAPASNPAYVVCHMTLVGAVVFNEASYDSEGGLFRSLSYALLNAATLSHCSPESLIHHAYAPTVTLTATYGLPADYLDQDAGEFAQAAVKAGGSAIKAASVSISVAAALDVSDSDDEDDEETSAFELAWFALSRINMEDYIKDEPDGSVYFRYDTGDNTVKENEAIYHGFLEDMRGVGYQIDDPQIEHDCISGTVIPLETEQ